MHRRRRRNGLVFYLTPHLKLREDCSLVSTFPWQQYHALPQNCFSHHTRCIIFKSACVRLFPLQKSFETFHNHRDERHAGMRDSLLQILSKIEQLKVFACHKNRPFGAYFSLLTLIFMWICSRKSVVAIIIIFDHRHNAL